MAGRTRRDRSYARPTSRSVAWWATAIALVACAVFGGSNRVDVPALIVLRPLLVVALAVLLLTDRTDDAKGIAPLAWLFGAWAFAIAWQLIPLPPAIWTALPGRSLVAGAGAVGGFAPGWHPVSLTPDRTWNSLLALLPAAVMLVGVTRATGDGRRMLVMVLLGIAFADLLAAVIQAATGASSALYFYRGTNDGGLSGLFANRNHNTAFLVATLPLLDAWARLPAATREQHNVRRVVAAIAAMAIAMLTLVGGSRAGLLLLGVCAVAIALTHRRAFFRLSRRIRIVLSMAAAGSFAGLVLLAIVFGRAASVDRLMGGSQSELRLVNMPVVVRIVRDHFPTGSGFGSFDAMFRSYEPDALLKPTFFNHAHNDLLETAMTGGLPAILVVLAFLAWFAVSATAAFRGGSATVASREASATVAFRDRSGDRTSGEGRLFARGAAIAIAVLLLASLVDYPLRTPFLAAVLALYCALLQIGLRVGDPAARLHAGEGISKGSADYSDGPARLHGFASKGNLQ